MSKMSTVTQIGADSHRRFTEVAGRDAEGTIVWRGRLHHMDRSLLREELRSWPRGTPVVLEATFGWGWLSDEMAAAGLTPRLASSTKVAAWRRARGLAKSNRIDAELLSELPMRDGQRWWEVWLAPPCVRDQRETLRHRMTLVRTQTGFKNRIHAILHRHGIVNELSDLFGAVGRRMLNGLVTSADERLSLSGRRALKSYLQMLDHLRRQIAQVTREVWREISRTPAGERLRTLPGIAFILAYTILAEVGEIGRFRSARHLASYSCMVPRAYDSGEDDGEAPQGRHIGHLGRRTLKWAWIEAAHGAVRGDVRMRAIFDQRTNGGKRDRNRGYIAVGHELCRVAYALWKQERDYMPEPPARPGSKRTVPTGAASSASADHADGNAEQAASGDTKNGARIRRTSARKQRRSADAMRRVVSQRTAADIKHEISRPGTGQPSQPMVVAE